MSTTLPCLRLFSIFPGIIKTKFCIFVTVMNYRPPYTSRIGLYCSLDLGCSSITEVLIISLRFIRRLTPYNVSVRTWASCAVELTSGLELITSFRLLRFYFSSNFYVSYIIGKLGICCFQRYATLKNLSSRKGAVIS